MIVISEHITLTKCNHIQKKPPVYERLPRGNKPVMRSTAWLNKDAVTLYSRPILCLYSQLLTTQEHKKERRAWIFDFHRITQGLNQFSLLKLALLQREVHPPGTHPSHIPPSDQHPLGACAGLMSFQVQSLLFKP